MADLFDSRPIMGEFSEFARKNGIHQVPDLVDGDDDDTKIAGHTAQWELHYWRDGQLIEKVPANLLVSPTGDPKGGQWESAVLTLRVAYGMGGVYNDGRFDEWVSYGEFRGQVPPRVKPTPPAPPVVPIGAAIPGMDGCRRDMGSGHQEGERLRDIAGVLYEFTRKTPFYAYWRKV